MLSLCCKRYSQIYFFVIGKGEKHERDYRYPSIGKRRDAEL